MYSDVHDKALDESFGGVLLDVSKLWAMTLVQFDRVLVMDADALILEPIDEVWETTAADCCAHLNTSIADSTPILP